MPAAEDDAVMAATSGMQRVTAADGRTLTIAECGDSDGFPVFFLHGTPGSRFAGQGDASAYADVGARVITYDRPGYGGSDRSRGRRVVDCVADVSAIADSLGIERFAVTGGSWGGPHSLAVAARLPEQVTRAACVAGPAPFDVPGFDWFADMDAVNINEIGWALDGEDVLAAEIERMAAAWLERVNTDPSKAGEVEFSEADRALCLIQPWGFDVTEIRPATRIDYGLTDVLVPRQHGEWLAQNVPNAQVVIDEKGGHFSAPQLVTERFGWLVESV
jgi:pimeloyl-ACP methyl ester carboxylesterase